MATDPPPPDRPRSPWVVIVLLGLVVLLLAGVVAYQRFARDSSPPQRPGSAMVFQIERKSPSLLHPSAPGDPAEFESFRQSQAALVRSRRTLNAALNAPGIRDIALIRDARPDPISWLADNLRVTVNPSSNFMTVELDGENGGEVIPVLDAIGKAYLATTVELTNGSLIRRQAELEKVIMECASELKRYTLRLEEIALLISGTSQRSATLAIGDQFMAKEFEKVSDELRRVRLDRALYLANPPAPRHPGPESAPIAVAGGAPAALPQRPTAAPDGLDSPEGKAFAAREQFWSRELVLIRDAIEKTNNYALEMNNLRRRIRAQEADLERYDAAQRETKNELRAPPRVFMVEEPYFRLGK